MQILKEAFMPLPNGMLVDVVDGYSAELNIPQAWVR